MWAFIKALLAKWVLLRVLLKTLGSLGLLVPLAFLLKMIGLPVLIVLAILALPVFIVLAVIGLPFILVFVVGGGILALIFSILALGLTVLKIVLPIILVVWLLRWLFAGPSRKEGTDPPPAA